MGDIIDDFRARISQNNSFTDGKSAFMYNLKTDFEQSLLTDASAIDIEIYKPENQFNNEKNEIKRVIINEIATNDQKSFDEKYILSRKEDNFKYGMYILFDGWYWIIDFQEYQTQNIYNKHVIRRCNKMITFNAGNKEYYKIPVVSKNLTQYSDGMQDVKYTSISDNRVSCMLGINIVTRNIKLGERFIINQNSYRVTFIENYQFSEGYDSDGIGLGNIIMIYDPKHDTDDMTLKVDKEKDTKIVNSDIIGSTKIVPSGTYIYTYSGNTDNGYVWDIEYTGNKKYITIEDKSDSIKKICKIKIENDLSLIGDNVKLKLLSADKSIEYANMTLNVSVF